MSCNMTLVGLHAKDIPGLSQMSKNIAELNVRRKGGGGVRENRTVRLDSLMIRHCTQIGVSSESTTRVDHQFHKLKQVFI